MPDEMDKIAEEMDKIAEEIDKLVQARFASNWKEALENGITSGSDTFVDFKALVTEIKQKLSEEDYERAEQLEETFRYELNKHPWQDLTEFDLEIVEDHIRPLEQKWEAVFAPIGRKIQKSRRQDLSNKLKEILKSRSGSEVTTMMQRMILDGLNIDAMDEEDVKRFVKNDWTKLKGPRKKLLDKLCEYYTKNRGNGLIDVPQFIKVICNICSDRRFNDTQMISLYEMTHGDDDLTKLAVKYYGDWQDKWDFSGKHAKWLQRGGRDLTFVLSKMVGPTAGATTNLGEEKYDHNIQDERMAKLTGERYQILIESGAFSIADIFTIEPHSEYLIALVRMALNKINITRREFTDEQIRSDYRENPILIRHINKQMKRLYPEVPPVKERTILSRRQAEFNRLFGEAKGYQSTLHQNNSNYENFEGEFFYESLKAARFSKEEIMHFVDCLELLYERELEGDKKQKAVILKRIKLESFYGVEELIQNALGDDFLSFITLVKSLEDLAVKYEDIENDPIKQLEMQQSEMIPLCEKIGEAWKNVSNNTNVANRSKEDLASIESFVRDISTDISTIDHLRITDTIETLKRTLQQNAIQKKTAVTVTGDFDEVAERAVSKLKRKLVSFKKEIDQIKKDEERISSLEKRSKVQAGQVSQERQKEKEDLIDKINEQTVKILTSRLINMIENWSYIHENANGSKEDLACIERFMMNQINQHVLTNKHVADALTLDLDDENTTLVMIRDAIQLLQIVDKLPNSGAEEKISEIDEHMKTSRMQFELGKHMLTNFIHNAGAVEEKDQAALLEMVSNATNDEKSLTFLKNQIQEYKGKEDQEYKGKEDMAFFIDDMIINARKNSSASRAMSAGYMIDRASAISSTFKDANAKAKSANNSGHIQGDTPEEGNSNGM